MQALLDAIAAAPLPTEACRIFHGRGGLHPGCEGWTLDAYTNVFADERFQQTFGYSLFIGVCTVLVGLFIVVPAAYYIRLRAPHLRPIVEFVTLLPLIVPAIVLVFGYIRLYNSSSLLPLTNSTVGTGTLLTFAYVAVGDIIERTTGDRVSPVKSSTLEKAAKLTTVERG